MGSIIFVHSVPLRWMVQALGAHAAMCTIVLSCCSNIALIFVQVMNTRKMNVSSWTAVLQSSLDFGRVPICHIEHLSNIGMRRGRLSFNSNKDSRSPTQAMGPTQWAS
ncbi:hypothetical protein L208DRAFT_1468124, partial [Tricholoma matsutake]